MSAQPLLRYHVPTRDGEVTAYRAFDSVSAEPRLIYVNGIMTQGEGHALDAMEIARVSERVVLGVFNATASVRLGQAGGMVGDLFQCGIDWVQIFLSKVTEYGALGVGRATAAVRDWFQSRLGLRRGNFDPDAGAEEAARRIPLESERIALMENWLRHNPASRSLFNLLRRGLRERQWIVAHSQGNLITSNALWGIVFVYGQHALRNMEVFSLASPSPAWPRGLHFRRKVYGYENDLVTLFDPHNWPGWARATGGVIGRSAGNWQRQGRVPSLRPHGLDNHMASTLFKKRLRERLGLPPE